jgi:hypothetical protein
MARPTQEFLKEQYEEFKDDIAYHQGEIDVIWARIRVLQKQCKHPNSYQYSAMGELGIKCPDCGYQT